MTRPQPSEHAEQSALIQWFDLYGPTRGLHPNLLIAIPNAAKRSYRLAARMKAEGMRAGSPDLFLAHPTRFNGLFIELKKKVWKPPKSGKALEHHERQLKYMILLCNQGYQAQFCLGFDDAKRTIMEYCEE